MEDAVLVAEGKAIEQVQVQRAEMSDLLLAKFALLALGQYLCPLDWR